MKVLREKNKIRIYGAGGHSQVIREVLEENGYEITETFDDKPSGRHYASKKVNTGARENLKEFKHDGDPIIIAVGINKERAEISRFLKSDFEKAIHHTAFIAKSAKIGKGTVIFAGAIIQPNTIIGEHVIVNTSASIDHDNIIGDYAHISPKAALCGHVEVGEGSHVGVGALVIPKVKIGKWCTVGAGAVVLKDVPDYSTVVGNPGRVIKTEKVSLENSEQNISDITFVGSGISSSFTILNFLDLLEESNEKKKINITIIDKFDEFHTGIPYGKRSGFSTHLITSLKNFLPNPELDKFINWLNNNKNWLLDELIKDGGSLSKDWINSHADAIKNNQWHELFIPRRFFGWYLDEKIKNRIEEYKVRGWITVKYVTSEVLDIQKSKDSYKLFLKNNQLLISSKVVLSIGSLSPKQLYGENNLVEKENLLFVNNAYEPTLDNTLKKINTFLSKLGAKANVLVVGANASGLEMIYKLNDDEVLNSKIDKFSILSTQGLLPDSVVCEEGKNNFTAYNLKALEEKEKITAQEIANAAYRDLDYADEINLKPASTVDKISEGFRNLLKKLDEKELKEFACKYGNEIGRRQRCAGVHYSKTIDALIKDNRFEHIAGRFKDLKQEENYSLVYIDSVKRENKIHETSFNVIINCAGSRNLEDKMPELLQNLISKEYCKLNSSKIGFDVNESLEASENLHIVGPLLSGNIIEGNAVWHTEHCGRIIWVSKIAANSLYEYFFRNTESHILS